tara:strand:+ start:649 stop:840 length:192 start_codon:yes stop_codon:yes gene_type:complete
MKTEKNTLYYAEQWFKLQDIPTLHTEKNIYLIINNHFEIEITEEEIKYRAELFLQSEIQKTNY